MRYGLCLLVVLSAISAHAADQCIDGLCPASESGFTQTGTSVVPVYFASDPVPAAGIYVGVIQGRGVTLTCRHAAQHGVRAVGRNPATGCTFDKFGYDLAAVFTRPLNLPRIIVRRTAARVGQVVRLIGYPLGRLRSRVGRVLGRCRADPGQQYGHLRLDRGSTDGDSGGAVLDSEGRLIGMIWGTRSDGTAETVAVPREAIADFLVRIEAMLAKHDAGESHLEAGPAPVPIVEAAPPLPVPVALPPKPTEEIQPVALPVSQEENALSASAPLVSAVATGFGGRFLPAAITGLGFTGPPAIIALVGFQIWSFIRRRQRKKKSPAVSASEFPGETTGTIPRDDEEARQFLQLSRFEGRSPLHDALVGRLTFDELDKTIESKPDGSEADWARTLRRRLEDRFNQMAPTAVYDVPKA